MNTTRRHDADDAPAKTPPWHAGFVTWKQLLTALVGLAGVVAVDRLGLEKRVSNLETQRDESSKTHDDIKAETDALRTSIDGKFAHIQTQLSDILTAFTKHEVRQQMIDEGYTKPGVRIPAVGGAAK